MPIDKNLFSQFKEEFQNQKKAFVPSERIAQQMATMDAERQAQQENAAAAQQNAQAAQDPQQQQAQVPTPADVMQALQELAQMLQQMHQESMQMIQQIPQMVAQSIPQPAPGGAGEKPKKVSVEERLTGIEQALQQMMQGQASPQDQAAAQQPLPPQQ